MKETLTVFFFRNHGLDPYRIFSARSFSFSCGAFFVVVVVVFKSHERLTQCLYLIPLCLTYPLSITFEKLMRK